MEDGFSKISRLLSHQTGNDNPNPIPNPSNPNRNPSIVLPDNAYLSLGKRLHFRGPTLPVIAVATSEVGPAALLFVEEVCQVLRFQTNSVPRYQEKYLRPKYHDF